MVGVLAAAALGWGLWESRNLPFVADIGTLLAHRGVGDYTLSMSHFFDLTGPSFAALRLPAALAAIALLIGPAVGWLLRLKRKHMAATVSVALTSAVFLIAAHIAFARFEPMLSSKQMADTIIAQRLARRLLHHLRRPVRRLLGHLLHAQLLPRQAGAAGRCSAAGQHGEGSSLLWGSCYPDAPDIFLSEDQLVENVGHGRAQMALRPGHSTSTKPSSCWPGGSIPVQSIADKALWTDRPLTQAR